jgi:hypothetical protein
MFKGQHGFIFYGHIVNDHTSMKNVNHNAPIPLFTQFLDYAKKWLQHAKSPFKILLSCFLLSCKLILFLPLQLMKSLHKDWLHWIYYWRTMLRKEGHAHIHMKGVYISFYLHVHHMCFRHMTFVCKKHEFQKITFWT